MTSFSSASAGPSRLTYFAVVLVTAAPAVYGCQPPWASGSLLAAVMLLAAVFVLRQVRAGARWQTLPLGIALPGAALLAWLIAGVARDMVLGPQHDPVRVPALSLQRLAYVGAFYSAAVLGAEFCSNAARRVVVLRALLVLGLVMAGFALLQFWGWDVKKLAGWTDITHRPSGLYTNANRFAVLMTLCWMGANALFLDALLRGTRGSSRERLRTFLLLLVVLLLSVCIALTLSRLTIVATAIALVVAAAVWLVLNRKKNRMEEIEFLPIAKKFERLALVVLPLVVVAAWGVWCLMVGASTLRNRFAELQPDLGLDSRVQAVRAALPLLKEHPVWGHGLGSFETVFATIQPPHLEGRWRELHCDWLQWAIEAGIPALVLAVLLAGAWSFEVWRILKCDESPLLRLLPAAGVLVFLLCSLGDFPLREPASATLFFFVAGALCASAPQAAAKPGRLSSGLGLLAAAALLAGAFFAGRNALAYASSPWLGSLYPPAASASQLGAWQRAARTDPGDPELQFRLATCAFAASAAGDSALAQSRDAAQTAQRLQPADHRFPWIEAAVAERAGDLDLATRLRERAAALYPNNPVLREQNGRFYLSTQVLRSVPGEPQREAGIEQCLENFRVVLKCSARREESLIEAMESAGCLNTEIAGLWPGAGDGPRVRRARFYCAKGQWDYAERDLPNSEPAGNSERRWYHGIRGAIALRRGQTEPGMQDWKQALAAADGVLDNWLATQALTLRAADCESLAGVLMPELVKYPGLSGVFAGKLMEDRRWASADHVLEQVAGLSPELGAQWAELALQLGDLAAASHRARLAWEQGLSMPRWGDWYSQFQERIRLRKVR